MDIKRKKIFFTSDWHVGHANVIRFDNRPFKDLDHMHRVLINNYNSCVDDDSVCYFLGDMGLCKSEIVEKVVKQLNGTKVLILGNHDRNAHSMYSQGFDVVLNAGIFYIADKRFSLSHCPLPGIYREDVSNMANAEKTDNWHGERKNQMFTSYDYTVDFHLHGHIHSGPETKDMKPRTTDRQFDVGVRANGYRPVSISQIESWAAIETQKKAKHQK
jgi:calcineurin-like phosphoesterase family protein